VVEANGNNLVFLLCTPRSGSSLATAMLQNHSRMFATQEMWFLMSLRDLRSPTNRPYGGTGILNQFFNGVLPDDTFVQACRAFALEVYNGLLRSSGGAEIVIDKSPRYYGVLEFLDALFPQSRRIWLIRNPFAVLASYKKVSRHRGTRFDLKEDLRNPAFNMKIADLTVGWFRYLRYFAGNSPYACRLHYERLVADPREELSRVCRFLGTTYEEGMEKYGDGRNPGKTGLFYSMGVGDPFLADHTEPHLDSVNLWKEVLDRQEVEMYGRALGARIFHELGYGEPLAEAEKWTGVRFDMEPDAELIAMRTKQLTEAAGFRWADGYEMQTGSASGRATVGPEAGPEAPARRTAAEKPDRGPDPQVLQLQMTLRALEKRLEISAAEQRRLKAQLGEMRKKVDRLKSIIPFGSRLSHLASAYLIHGGGKK
jgi:hypothetical protein